MTSQALLNLAEKLMAMDDKYVVAKELNKLITDAKLDGMKIIKEIVSK